MNCEKCKNKAAVVFYADDAGGRHSLCESCAAILGHIGRFEPYSEEKNQAPDSFTPICRLSSLSHAAPPLPILSASLENGKLRCQYCATELVSVIQTGEVGCPECYEVFSPFLIPASLDCESAPGARMPLSRRSDIERIHMLTDMKKKLREAIDSESFELAATLRDEIRRLDGKLRR